MKDGPYDDWIGFHLFYQGSRDRLLVNLVTPLICRLWSCGAIKRFFFMRYSLGGPHIRLRLHCAPDRRHEASVLTREMADAFFTCQPSQTVLTEEEIRRTNRRLIANDLEGEDEIYPNNSLLEFPFRAEVERYGGQELLEHSLDFFSISSLDALKFAENRPATALAAIAARLAGLAMRLKKEAFADLLLYASVWSKNYGALFNQRGDEEFERKRPMLLQMLRQEIEAAASQLSPTTDRSTLLDAGCRLALATAGADELVRQQIAVGQMHMMVNRLGLNNAEEIYLGRLLWRSAQALRDSDPDFWNWSQHALASGHRHPRREDRLQDLLPYALSAFCQGHLP
jgi:hypothetical protein